MGKSSSSTNKPWDKAQPYMLGGADQLQSVYNKNQGKIQEGADSIGGLLPGAIEKYKAGNPMLDAANSYNTDVLGGKYLDQGNPYLQQMIDQTGNDVRNQTQAGLGTHGLTGGSDYTKMIADRVAQAGLGMRYQDYSNERGLMGQASGQAPGMIGAEAMRLNPMMSLLDTYNAPGRAAGDYAGSLGGLLGGYKTQTNNPSAASQVGSALSTATGLAALFSDRRLKTDIRRVGQTDEGLPLYRYRYLGEGPYHVGAMADEVAEMQPHALGPVVDGFATVVYSELR